MKPVILRNIFVLVLVLVFAGGSAAAAGSTDGLSAPAQPQARDAALPAGLRSALYRTLAKGINVEPVPTKLDGVGGSVRVEANDARAVYPQTADPLTWIGQEVTDETLSFGFGISVAIDGTTALIGVAVPAAVYVFSNQNGPWTLTQTLTADDGGAGFGFSSVALDGSTALVGAGRASVNGHAAQGAVYVFTESDGEWSQTQKLVASDGAVNDQFGTAIAISGKTAVIGAYNAAVNDNIGQGAAYVFTRSKGEWTQSAKLTSKSQDPGAQFGISVALGGTTAIVGAELATVDGVQPRGAAYVFNGSGGNWILSQKLAASDGIGGESFGRSVALDGATALIGAPGTMIDGNGGQGAAYVFVKADGHWSQVQKLYATDGNMRSAFGRAVALEAPVALIGSYATNVGDNAAQGVAYLYTNSGGSWSQSRELVAKDGTASASFGAAVALADMNALVGALGTTINNQPTRGASYFYGGADLSLSVSAPETVSQGQTYVSQTIATNNASIASPAFAVTIPVPPAASFISAQAARGSCNEASYVVHCKFEKIPGNAGVSTADVTFKVITGYLGEAIKNTANVVNALPALTASAYTVVGSSNQPPVAKDGTLITDENKKQSEMLQATDPDGDPLYFVIVDQPSHGSVTMNDPSKGEYTYAPDEDYAGNDNFTFKASDGLADSNVATISITVKAINRPPVASDGTLTTKQGASASGTLEASDPDGDALVFSIVNQPQHGSVTVDDSSAGTYTYTPDKNYSGSDSFTFKANDGQADSNAAIVKVTVNATAPPSEGGGGALDWLILVALLGLIGSVVMKRRRS